MIHNKIRVEQLQDETRQDYIKFCAFLNMGPKRDLNRVYQAFYETDKEVSSTWRNVAAKNRWLERALTYDKAVETQHNKS